MPDYIKVVFSSAPTDKQEILIALLSESGYDGFEEDRDRLTAYIIESEFNEDSLQRTTKELDVNFTFIKEKEQNWNAVWESSFHPVVVDDFVAIRADFHLPIRSVEHEIVITPKMSFGTGHHATTFMMMQQMRSINFDDKSVFDFGTGTGVLAILAGRLGAARILGIDYDEWSITNAEENAMKNGTTIELQQADTAIVAETFDVILANINRNVIMNNMGLLGKALEKNTGIMLLSGLLISDEVMVVDAAKKYGLELAGKWEREGWICVKLVIGR